MTNHNLSCEVIEERERESCCYYMSIGMITYFFSIAFILIAACKTMTYLGICVTVI